MYLTDGTFLPCIIFRNPKTKVNLAIRRFKEEQTGKGVFKHSSGLDYYDIVKSFVTNGNCINDYDIDRVEKSKFVFPLKIQSQIQGETTMGWTGYAAKMRDGRCFGFGTTFRWEFFQMPEGYSVDDIEEIINHSYVLQNGELRSHRDGTQTIAKLISKKSDFEEDVKLFAHKKVIYEICLILLGLITIVLTVPDFIFKLRDHINLVQNNTPTGDYDMSFLITSGIKIGIGIVAIIYSTQLSYFFAKRNKKGGQID